MGKNGSLYGLLFVCLFVMELEGRKKRGAIFTEVYIKNKKIASLTLVTVFYSM
jgi:hypothetical protein